MYCPTNHETRTKTRVFRQNTRRILDAPLLQLSHWKDTFRRVFGGDWREISERTVVPLSSEITHVKLPPKFSANLNCISRKSAKENVN